MKNFMKSIFGNNNPTTVPSKKQEAMYKELDQPMSNKQIICATLIARGF
jgi:hypothetical protein